ncbi:MAG: DUF3037 domain-containing protein [Nitrospirae bacterium]|nr:DUF3037 domain-containing protein [Nitrospirota bacterium]
MKIPYSFSVLRYIHDIVSGEFINVGVVLYAPKARFLSAVCTSRYARISKMFSNINGDHFRQVSRYIQARLEEEGDRLVTELPFEKMPVSVKDFTPRVLPIDDSSLQFSDEGYGLTENPQETLEQIYNRYVEKYYEKTERQSRSDEDVWKVYKKPLEERRILSNLVPHHIIGNNYDHEFKYCWKNEQWRIHEPVSFDLLEAGSITDKANVWLGRITSLMDGGEPFKINILIGSPQDERLKSSFVKAQNIMNRMNCPHEFIKEDEAEDFAEHLKEEIESHSE